jgi:hypothetical protein
MQYLNRLKVPWQVSPSTPFLRLQAAEPSDGALTQVIFVAHFGLRGDQTASEELAFSSAPQAANPHELPSRVQKESNTHSLVRIEFRDGLWARFSPSFSDREVLDPMKFNCSLIPCLDPSNDIGRWVRDFQSLWMKSGECPDPGAYVVESSDWIEQLSMGGFQHFLIQGHDAYAEVLARGWKWEEIRRLPESW